MKLLGLYILAFAILVSEAKPFKKLHKIHGQAARDEIKDLLRSVKGGHGSESEKNHKGNSLKILSESFARNGRTTIRRLHQRFQGVPVFGAHVITAETDGVVEGIDGNYAEDLHADLGDVIHFKGNPDKALKDVRKFLRDNGKKGVDVSVGQCEQIIYVDPQSGIAEAAHQCTLDLQPEDISVPRVIISDQGKVLRLWDLIQGVEIGQGPGGNKKTGMYNYGSANLSFFEVDQKGTSCSLVYKDAGGTIRVQTSDNRKSRRISRLTGPHTFPCTLNDEPDVNEGYSSLNDAHHHAVLTYKMFATKYADIGLIPFSIKAYAHFDINYDNAYWDGNANYLVVGDGGTYFYPLVSLDVLAHEVCHGVTQFNSDLVYDGESGGINEAFSDMCGIAAEYYQDPTKIDWKIGEKIGKPSKPYQNELRCMNNPPACGDKYSIASLCKFTNTTDVHDSSGIFNKAFYNIATIPNVNIEIAFRMFYSANRFKWTPTSDSATAAEGVLFYAEDWQSKYSYDIGAVVNAFKDVGISCTDSTPTAGGWDCVRSCP